MDCMYRSHPESRLCPAVHHPASCDCDDYQTGRVKCLEMHAGGWLHCLVCTAFLLFVMTRDFSFCPFCLMWSCMQKSNIALIKWCPPCAAFILMEELLFSCLSDSSYMWCWLKVFKQQTCREAQPALANQKAERVRLVLERTEQQVLIVRQFLHFSPTKCAIKMLNFMLIQSNIRSVNQLPQQWQVVNCITTEL